MGKINAILGLLCFLLISIIVNGQQQKPYKEFNGAFMLKNAKWPSKSDGRTVINVSWENPSPENEKERQWVKEAIEATWSKYANIHFVGWGKANENTRGIRIIVDNNGHPHTNGLGTQIDGMKGGMLLNFKFLGRFTCSRNQEDCIKFIAVHEFGHALGLAHEHNRPDCLCGEEPQGTAGDVFLTPCDINSVMNYCNPKWSNYGQLSDYDKVGIQKVYGLPNAITNVISLNEIRFVPCNRNKSNILLDIKKSLSIQSIRIIKYTQETEDVPANALRKLPEGNLIIRYFHPDDEAKAAIIKKTLSSSYHSINVQNMIPYFQDFFPSYLEIWIK